MIFLIRFLLLSHQIYVALHHVACKMSVIHYYY